MAKVLPDCWEVTCGGTLPGNEIWRNVFHFATAGTPRSPTAADAQSVASNLQAFYDNFNNFLMPQWVLNLCVVRRVGFEPSPPPQNGVIVLAGTSVDTKGMPNDCAVCISWTTEVNSRRSRGRNYLCGFDQASVSYAAAAGPANVAPAVRTAIATAGDQLSSVSVGVPATYQLVIASRSGPSGNDPSPENFFVTGGYVNNVWDTMRKRDNAIVPVKTTF